MGVDLGSIAIGEPVGLEQLRGKTFAVDAFNTIYQFLSSIRQPDGTQLMDFKGRVTSHLSGVFYRNTKLLAEGVRPVYVFDGEPPSFKMGTIGERSQRKDEAQARFLEARGRGDLETARKYAQATSHLTSEMVEETKKLLSLMGLPYCQAPSEGEAQAAQLVQEGTAYAVASQDFDALLFGSPLLLRNLSITGRRKVPRQERWAEIEPEMISLEKVLATNSLSRSQLIWIAMLIGTDFNQGIKGVGPKKALQIAHSCQSFEDVLEHCRTKFSYEFPEDAKAVMNFFLHPPVKKGFQPVFGLPDRDGLRQFLCEEHDFSEARVVGSIETLDKKLKEKGEQSGLGKWF